MSEPIVFISNQRIIEGKIEGYKQYYRQVAEMTEAAKPGTVGHLAYISEDGTEATIVDIFPAAGRSLGPRARPRRPPRCAGRTRQGASTQSF